MTKNNFVKMLVVWSAILAEVAIGLALASGGLPIIFGTFVMPTMIMQIAGWTVVGGGVLAALQTAGLMKK